MKTLFFASFLSIIFTACSTTSKLNPQKEADTIVSVMKLQEIAWNKGDLEEFMLGYWKSDSLRFVSNFKITYGWDQTLANYKRGYPNKVAMGTLGFDILDVDVLSSTSAIVLGRYTLQYSEGPITGLFTLTWKKIKGEWKIVSDMTCG